MKKICLFIFLISLSSGLSALKGQKRQMLAAEQIQSTSLTVEQLVRLKPKFIVTSCGIFCILREDGVDLMTNGTALCLKSTRIQPCNNANPSNFINEWIRTAPKVAKGGTITVWYIYIKKGDEQRVHYGSKNFRVP